MSDAGAFSDEPARRARLTDRLRDSLLLRVAFASTVILGVAALFLQAANAERRRQDAVEEWSRSAVVTVDAIQDELGIDAWPLQTVDPSAYDATLQRLAVRLGPLADAGFALRREDGTIVMASEPEVIGTTDGLAGERATAALEGRQVSAELVRPEVSPLAASTASDELLRTVLPVAVGPDGGVVLEAFHDFTEDARSIEGTQLTTWATFGVALIALLLVTVPLVIRHDQKLENRGAVLRQLLAKERERAERRDEVEQMKSAFLTAASYQLSTPVQAILLVADRMRSAAERLTPQQVRDLAHRLERGVSGIERLTTDLLQFDRIQEGVVDRDRERVNGTAVATEVVRAAELGSREVLLPAQPVEFLVDPEDLATIVRHLIDNLREHTPEGTTARLKTWREEGAARLSLEDDGPGIPTELKLDIFDPLSTGPSGAAARPGAGLGLAIVKALAESYGGRAWVETPPAGGAVFQIRLPDETIQKRTRKPPPQA